MWKNQRMYPMIDSTQSNTELNLQFMIPANGEQLTKKILQTLRLQNRDNTDIQKVLFHSMRA